MAKKLTNVKTKMGQLIRVENLKRKWNLAAREYLVIHVENDTGKSEYPIMLTRAEYLRLAVVYLDVPIKAGRLYPFQMGNTYRYLLKVIDEDNAECIVLLSDKMLSAFSKRASNNPEDVPKKSMLTDLLD